MKLTLSEISVVTERRYTLDKPANMEIRPDVRVRVTEFITISRTYEYGETEHEFRVRGRLLKADGSPDQRKEAADFDIAGPNPSFPHLPDYRAPFIEALWAPTQL